MVFKRIDRYVSTGFLVRFFGVIILIGSLYTSFDILKRMEDLEELEEAGLQDVVGTLTTYYLCLIPTFLLDLVPGIVLVAAGMVLVRMAKRGELMTLKASGTSLHRSTAPVLFWTLLISIGAFAVREVLGPEMGRRKDEMANRLEQRVERELLVRDESTGRWIYLAGYDFTRDSVVRLAVMEFHPAGGVSKVLQGESARWLPGGGLVLEKVSEMDFHPDGSPAGEERNHAELSVELGLTRSDLVEAAEKNEAEAAMRFSLGDLRRMIRTQPGVPVFRVAFHSRLAGFFSPLILLLAGVPCLVGFERSINSRFLGVIVCIVLAAALYALIFIMSSMGTSGTINPVLAGWLPAMVCGSGGLWLYQSMLT